MSTARLDRYLDDPMAFRREQLILDSAGTRLGDVIEDWQVDRVFKPLDARQDDGRYRYRLAYLELPRGHAKTTMVAAEAVTQLVFGGPEWRGHMAAGDRDQARELFDAAVGFVRRNPALEPAFAILRDRLVARHTGATLRVHSADAPTAHGLQVSWFAIDEFWNQPSRDLWDAFYTAVVKRPNWRGIVITTAGFDKESICWQVRQMAQDRDDFYAFLADGQLASWITDEEIDRLRDTLPPHIFQRFVENKWVEGAGSFITREALQRCIDDRLAPESHGYRGINYYLGVDLGLKKDRTAAAIVHRDGPHVVLDDLAVWEGTRTNPVSIADVEDWIRSAAIRFPLRRIVMDPWQAQSTVQRFAGVIEEFTFTAQRVARLSSNLFHLIQTAALRLYPDEDLEQELVELQAEQTSYGWRIDHARNKHDDRAMAIGMAALAASTEPPVRHARMSTARFGRGRPKQQIIGTVGGQTMFVNEHGRLATRPGPWRPPHFNPRGGDT
jgi:phage terminase large subunit-like protein